MFQVGAGFWAGGTHLQPPAICGAMLGPQNGGATFVLGDTPQNWICVLTEIRPEQDWTIGNVSLTGPAKDLLIPKVTGQMLCLLTQ